ncbi:Beta-galactosidase-1-like protein 3 [Blattella germanica]|nr:Beta-galactosidase-1-like protein 3 [Blattella germanica]
MHEPEQDVYDFGDGGNDMSIFLDVVKYIKMAQEEDLLVLVRPSPYICSEWDFGGMPSWLLRYPGLVVRSSEPQFLERVRKYNNKLLPLFKELQFTRGGPIIGFQIENEYGGLIEDGSPIDMKYLLFLKDEFEKHNIVELLYTSDNPSIHGERGAIPEVLQTANFQTNPENELSLLKKFQPNKPLMVMEFWAGWFDHWFEHHHTTPVAGFSDTLDRILKFPSSVNLYMFHGGTNFGFLNGANVKGDFPHYNAPLSEAGDYTDKYRVCKELVEKYNKVITKLPPPPAESKKVTFPSIPITEQMDYTQILENIGPEDRDVTDDVVSMEHLKINNGNGQSYGYIIYRHSSGVKVKESSKLQIKDGVVHDMAIVLLDEERQTEILTNQNQLKGFGYWETPNSVLNIESKTKKTKTLDILVENWGRVNFGLHSDFEQCKGLRKGTKILFDNEHVKGWETFSLQFKSKWLRGK